MRARRFLGSLIATTLAAGTLGLVATASPASAATATQIVGGTPGKGWIYSNYPSQPGGTTFGDTISLDIEVKAGTTQVYDGTLTVQAQYAGSKSWTTVKTSSSAYLYDSIKAKKNATYRVLYSGTSTYAATGSQVVAKIQRKISLSFKSGRQAIVTGKVSPKFTGKATIYRKVGKKWKPFKKVKAHNSKIVSALPAPRSGNYLWFIKIAPGGGFSTSTSGKFKTYSL